MVYINRSLSKQKNTPKYHYPIRMRNTSVDIEYLINTSIVNLRCEANALK